MCPADILAGRKTVGKITGTVLFAGHKPGVQFLRRYSAYVEQFGKASVLRLKHHISAFALTTLVV